MTTNIYLFYNGNCEEAFNFYKSVFRSEFNGIMRYGDSQDENITENEKNNIMHVSLPIGTSFLMGSDHPEKYGQAKIGNNFSVSVSADSKDEADRIFRDLSAGGQQTMPMQDTFWGSYFGMFTDKFAVNWMISFDKQA